MPNNNDLYDSLTGYMRQPANSSGAPTMVNPQDEEIRKLMNDSIRKIQERQPYSSGLNSLATPDLTSEYGRPKTPDEIKRAKEQLPIIVDSVRANTPMTFAESEAAFRDMSSSNTRSYQESTGVLGTPMNIPLSETHDMIGDSAIPKYDIYTPGIDNQERAAQMQTNSERWGNGLKKLILKTGLYGAAGMAFLPSALIGWMQKGSFSGVYDNSFMDFMNEIDERINHSLPHYYTREEEDMSVLRKLGTVNFWANDVLGNGVAFTTGAMLTAWMSGGLGLSNLGAMGARTAARNAAARLGRNLGRVGSRAGKSGGRSVESPVVREGNNLSIGLPDVEGTGRMPVSQAVRNAASQTKNALADFRRGLFVRPNLSNAAKTAIYGGLSAGWEAGVEANSTIKEAEEDFRNYIRDNYGREATSDELAAIRKDIEGASNAVFALNSVVVGSSNLMTFGKALGLSRPAMRFSGNGLGRKIKRHVFGIGVKSSPTKPGEMVVVGANLGQKVAANVWNMSKRPLSEGFYEEGLQGVFQNAADDYIRSRYDRNAFDEQLGLWDSALRGFSKQYTSNEGWTEITVGAMIGAMFGAREGMFGAFEARNERKMYADLAKKYNESNVFTNSSVKEAMKNSIAFNSYLSHAQQVSDTTYGDSNTDAAEFIKFSLSDEMGVLDSNAKDFVEMVKSLDNEELAKELGNISAEEAGNLKESVVNNYNEKLERYKQAKRFANEALEGTSYARYAPFVAEVAYKGLSSRGRILQAANDISEIVSREGNMSSDLMVYSRISEESRKKAKELSGLVSRIEDLNKQVEEYAINKIGMSEGESEARQEFINSTYSKISKLQSEADRLRDELSHLSVEDFSLDEMLRSTQNLLNEKAPTPEEVLAAYDSVRSIDYYLSGRSNKKEGETHLKHLVDEYKMNVTNYRNLLKLMNSFSDPRYMREHISMLDRIRDAFVKEQFPSMGEGYVPHDRDKSNANKAVDEKIDKAVKSGKMTADEAFTAKLFNHIRDEITDLPFVRSLEETLSDEDAENIINGNMDDRLDVVLHDIMERARNGERLTPNENRVYSRVAGREGSIESIRNSMIEYLDRKIKSYLNPKSEKEVYDNAISVIGDMLEDPASRKEYNRLVVAYMKAIRDRYFVDGDLQSLSEMIRAFSEENGIPNPAPFIELLYQLERNPDGMMAQETDFGSRSKDLNTINNDTPETGDSKTNQMCQNTSILFVRTTDKGFEFSNLDPKTFLETVSKRLPDGATDPVSVSDDGKTITLSWNTGDSSGTLTLKVLKEHGRFQADEEAVRAMEEVFGLTIPKGLSSYSIVGLRNSDGNVSPFTTGIKYNGQYINEGALSRVKRGDEVTLVIETNDPQNIKYFNESKSDKEFSDNVIIKVLDKDGNFISVLAAGKNGSEFRDPSLKGRFASSSGTIALGKAVVSQYYPGRPLFVMEGDRVSMVPIQEESLKNIKDVGYILNGELRTKNGKKANTYPYTTAIIRGADKYEAEGGYKGIAVPVVVFEAPNGELYAYPVSMRNTGRELSDDMPWVEQLKNDDNFTLDPSQSAELNSMLIAYGLHEYRVNMAFGTNEEVAEAARRAVEELSKHYSVFPVSSLLDTEASVEEIVSNRVEATTEFSEGSLLSPKIRIRKPGSASSTESLMEDLPYDEAGNKREPLVRENPPKYEGQDGNSTNTPKTPTNTTESVIPTTETETKKKRTSSKKNFSNYKDKLGDVEFVSIQDFLAYKIGFGDLVFEKSKKNGLEALMSREGYGKLLYKQGTDIDRGSKAKNGSLPISEFYDWLERNKDVPAVKAYLDTLEGMSEADKREAAERMLAKTISAFGCLKSHMVAFTCQKHGVEFQMERQDVTVESIVEEVEKMISEENLNPVKPTKENAENRDDTSDSDRTDSESRDEAEKPKDGNNENTGSDSEQEDGIKDTDDIIPSEEGTGWSYNEAITAFQDGDIRKAVDIYVRSGVTEAEAINVFRFIAEELNDDKLLKLIDDYNDGKRKDETVDENRDGEVVSPEETGEGTGEQETPGSTDAAGDKRREAVKNGHLSMYNYDVSNTASDMEKWLWFIAYHDTSSENNRKHLIKMYADRFGHKRLKDAKDEILRLQKDSDINKGSRSVSIELDRRSGDYTVDVSYDESKPLDINLSSLNLEAFPNVISYNAEKPHDAGNSYRGALSDLGEFVPVEGVYLDKKYVSSNLRYFMHLPFTGWYVSNIHEKSPQHVSLSDWTIKEGYVATYFYNPSTGDSFFIDVRNYQDIPNPMNRTEWGVRMASIDADRNSSTIEVSNPSGIAEKISGSAKKIIKGKC